MSSPVTLQSPLAALLRIEHPILLAGMAGVASPPLVAAVSNGGGLGVLGGGFPSPTPDLLRKQIKEIKELLHDKTRFGIDLLIPQVGGGARKTNYDYTKGKLPEMIDIICTSGARLFVCAVGVPPKWAVDKLHAAGVLCMNMIGAPGHVDKALAAGMDVICAQGYEGGGHTGDIAGMALLPVVVDKCRGRSSPLTGGPVHVVAAGAMTDGRSVAAAFALGAQAVWVGTRFVASTEATTVKIHKESLLRATAADTIRSVVYTGRPARVFRSPYVLDWEGNRRDEIERITKVDGKVPVAVDYARAAREGRTLKVSETAALAMGQGCGGITDIRPAADIIRSMMHEAVQVLNGLAPRCQGKL